MKLKCSNTLCGCSDFWTDHRFAFCVCPMTLQYRVLGQNPTVSQEMEFWKAGILVMFQAGQLWTSHEAQRASDGTDGGPQAASSSACSPIPMTLITCHCWNLGHKSLCLLITKGIFWCWLKIWGDGGIIKYNTSHQWLDWSIWIWNYRIEMLSLSLGTSFLTVFYRSRDVGSLGTSNQAWFD